jgi:hypothetical protein
VAAKVDLGLSPYRKPLLMALSDSTMSGERCRKAATSHKTIGGVSFACKTSWSLAARPVRRVEPA